MRHRGADGAPGARHPSSVVLGSVARPRLRHLRHRAWACGCGRLLRGGVLVTSDLAGLGWRAVFFVNVPFGLVILAAASRIMPPVPRRAGTRLDVPGAIVLFAGLLCLIGPR